MKNKAIRLKGCWNNFEGFPLGEDLLTGEKNHKEIFGCQFKNSCLREQFIAKSKLELEFWENLKLKSEKILSDEQKIYFINLIEELKINLTNNKESLFVALINIFSNISFELGKIKRCMENNNFNWGTFDDHCNAHLDNLLLVKRNKFKKLLSPIDFDLAFFKDEFIDLKYKNLKGIEAKVNFEDLITREKLYLLIQLLGINPIPNIDVDIPYFRNIVDEYCNKKKDDKKMYKNLSSIINYMILKTPFFF